MPLHLICVLEHPTQYDPPLWAALARRGRVEPMVWYARMGALDDGEMGQRVEWGRASGPGEVVADSDLSRRIATLRPRPDAVLTAGWTKLRTWRVLRAARALSVPVLLPSDKTLNEPSVRQPVRTALTVAHAAKARLFDGFVTTGTLGRAALRSAGIPPERIATGLYPVDIAWWERQLADHRESTAQLRRSVSGAFVVLAVCKLHDRENPFLVVEGFAELRRRLPLARLLFVGDGPLRREVQERVAALGVTGDVTLAGYVPYRELAAYYGAADAFVHVPRREPWGISVGEAMACRVPVVASTSVGAAADLVIGGRTGFLIEPNDPGALGEALLRLAQGATARDTGARARQQVECIDVDRAAEQLEELLKRLRSPAQSTPISSVVREDFLNRWGRWSA